MNDEGGGTMTDSGASLLSGTRGDEKGERRTPGSGVLRIVRMPVMLGVGGFWFVLAVVCTQIPLVQVLGYEYALIFGLAAGWTSAGASLVVLRRLSRLRWTSPLAAVVRDWLLLSCAFLLMLLPPAAVMTFNALFVRNCAPFEGMLLYLMIPGMTVLFSTALALLLRALFPSRAWPALLAILFVLLMQPVYEILSRPQLYSYNHVFGMFVGLSWDQHAPPLGTLAVFRILTLAISLMMLATAAALRAIRRERRVHPRRRTAIASLFLPAMAAAVVLTMNGDAIGYTNSLAHIRQNLQGEYNSEHFTLLYDTAAVDEEDIAFIAEEHEFRLHQVCTELRVEKPDRLYSVLYPDRQMRGRLLGTYSSEVARPWKGEIHLSMEGWSQSLKHELVHVMGREFGPNYIGVPFVRVLGLTEGLAMAIEWDFGNRSLHEYAAAMLRDGMLPPVRRIMSTSGFMSGTSSVGYVAGGSFARWLIDEYGLNEMKKAYAADDIEGSYARPYDELERGWHDFLHSVPIASVDSLTVAYLFRRPSLFTAMCPRTIGDRSRYASELLRKGDAQRALAEYRALERMAPSASSAFGIVQSLYQLGRMVEVRDETSRLLSDSTRAYSVLPLLLWQGVSHWSLGDSAQADAVFSRLVSIDLPGWTTDRAGRLLRVLREDFQDDSTRALMFASLRVTANADSAREHIARGLLALLRTRPGRPALFDEAMQRAATEKSLRHETFARLCVIPETERNALQHKVLGWLHYRRGEIAAARRCFERSLELSPEEKEIAVWIDRCAWKEALAKQAVPK
jgi:tetratricopeptide (TPR) repeat protein